MTTDQPIAAPTGASPRSVARIHAPTERRHPDTHDLDTYDARTLLTAINAADRDVPLAVASALPDLARLVDAGAASLRAGGRIHYFGAGTPGRLAVLDAAELLPTFSLEPGRVVAHIAGGDRAILRSQEGAEDDVAAGEDAAAGLTGNDVAIGITASGRTPYVRGALAAAGLRRATTALISANPDAAIADVVDHHVMAPTGPEVLAGSTRMKAGTAQKLILNAFSTAVMVQLGKTYSNLMVDVRASNAKLRGRMVTILVEATGLDDTTCRAALLDAGHDLKTALVMLLAEVDPTTAGAALDDSDGRVRGALAVLHDDRA